MNCKNKYSVQFNRRHPVERSPPMASLASLKSAIYDREERKQHYQAHIRGLNAYDRHNKFLNDYVKYYGKEEPSGDQFPVKTDKDTLREGYRFIRTEEDDMDTSWEQRLVKRYHNKLFKEYCIADMSKYKSAKIGLRWRTENEVISGKGQFICGNKQCDEKSGLASYEVNFSYFEGGENKQALVKLVTCERCTEKLHYRKNIQKKQLESRENNGGKEKRKVLRSDDERDDEDKKTIYGKRPKSEISEHGEKECSKRRRERSIGDGTFEEELDRSQERKIKGKRGLPASGADEEENFDEFLEGMFP